MGIIIRFIGRLIVSLFLLLFMYPITLLFVFILPLLWSFDIKKSWNSFIEVINEPIEVDSNSYNYWGNYEETIQLHMHVWDYLWNKITIIKNPNYKPFELISKEDKEVKRIKAKKTIIKALGDL